MTAMDPIGPAPETREPHFLWLLLGASAAPLFWLGQMMLNYGITAYVCYPADHPVGLAHNGILVAALAVFDIIALIASAAGGWISWSHWRQMRGHGEGHNRFLALWGVMSSLWFFVAILFNAIASLVPPCLS